MIRLFVIVGIVGGLAISYLAIFAVGPISQLPPSESLLTGFRARGIVPASVNLKEDEAPEKADVFTVPARDRVMLKQTKENAGAMSAMSKGDNAEAGKEMPQSMPMGDNMAKGGLLVTDEGDFDREIELTMSEWKFSTKKIEVKPGERIKFTVINIGQIPHEFMFMSLPLMSAVTYRATRADWSLVEHKALFEKALVLPKGQFSFVLKVTQPGTWRFMCMLPYHMQMGMMGQMSTPGMTTNMAM